MNYQNKNVKQLSDEDIYNVNGGTKVTTNGESSWLRTLVDFFFKINN